MSSTARNRSTAAWWANFGSLTLLAAPVDAAQLLWGDTHLHSSNSFDAFLNRNMSADPATAYRYAKGLSVIHPFHRARVQIETPLDFLVVADHAEYLEETFQEECVPIWDAANPDDPVRDPNEIAEDAPNHMVGLGVACRTLTSFVEAATAAGDTLDNGTFQAGLESLGEFVLPTYGPASLGAGKYDAQDDLVLWGYDPPNSDSKRGLARYEG